MNKLFSVTLPPLVAAAELELELELEPPQAARYSAALPVMPAEKNLRRV
jgi:hypothetical protein